MDQNQPKAHLKPIGLLGLALFIMTIILAQQIINTLFPEENSTRIIAKIVIDTALVAAGFGIHRNIVGTALLSAGIVRFIPIFFQLKGMEPFIRVVIMLLIVIVLFVVGYLKFVKNLNSGQRSGNEQ